MPNGDCAVGASNKARIEGLEAKQITQDTAMEEVADKLDRINWWLVASSLSKSKAWTPDGWL